MAKRRDPNKIWHDKQERIPKKSAADFARRAGKGSTEERAFNAARSRMARQIEGTFDMAQTSTALLAWRALIAIAERKELTRAQMTIVLETLEIKLEGMTTPTSKELSAQDCSMLLSKMRAHEDLLTMRATSKPSDLTDYSEIERRILGQYAESAGIPPDTGRSARQKAEELERMAYYQMMMGEVPTWTKEQFKKMYGMDLGKEDMGFRDKNNPPPGHYYNLPEDRFIPFPRGHPEHIPDEYPGAKQGRTYLFVGGAGAGQRHAVPKEHDFYRAAGSPGPLGTPRDYRSPIQPEYMEQSTYRRVEIKVGGIEMEVMGWDHMQPSQIAEELLKNYRPNAVDDCGECRSRSAYERMKK